MRFFYQHTNLAKDRDDVIVNLCKGKRVLHIGAADSPYTKEKLSNNLLLHKKLSLVTPDLFGIDLDSEAAQWLNEQGLPKIHVLDMNELGLIDFKPDIIIFGETIEHLTDIGNAIKTLKSCMLPHTRLIISTPNLFYIRLISMVIRNYEEIHDDHKVGFTYALLSQLLESQKLTIEDFYFTFLPRNRLRLAHHLWRSISKLRHGLAETLLFICKKNDL